MGKAAALHLPQAQVVPGQQETVQIRQQCCKVAAAQLPVKPCVPGLVG